MSDLLKFTPGVPVLSGDIPAAVSLFVSKLNWNIQVNFCKKTVDGITEEGYELTLNQTGAAIQSSTDRGLFYGFQTLLRKCIGPEIESCSIKESPCAEKRGLKLYLPAPNENGVQEFKRIVDFAAFCKCNFIMLELGGALEFKKHPEVNEGYVKYAADMCEYPEKPLEIQHNFPWRKNSIHTENGGGNIVSQKQFMEFVEYCRERYMEVIPEMPSLSHCDYLLVNHPEFAERQDDPYPDTCCPLHPEYHRIYNELLDEVIDLMHPAMLHIGHDEYYTTGLCPRCKGKSAPELYANDIDRIAAYLESQGVKCAIWGEKLLNSHWRNGEAIGGAELTEPAKYEPVPALYPSADLLKCKPEVFHWYWNVDRDLEKVYENHGFDYLLANFTPARCKDWTRRIHAPHAKGICISNWGTTSMRTLQRNGVLYDLLYGSMLMWDHDIREDDFPAIDSKVFRCMYQYYAVLNQVDGMKELTVTHTVSTSIQFKYFFDGYLLDEQKYYLGDHVFRAVDTGKFYRCPVIFGTNISNSVLDPIRGDEPDNIQDAYTLNLQYTEISGETLPERDADGTWWYRCRYTIPADCGKLEYVRFETANELVPNVKVRDFQ